MSLDEVSAISALIVLTAVVVGCGKRGPPLPPLVKLPTPPADFTAVRRGDTVSLQFTVPTTNTDNTRPANVERVDVYALTAPAAVADLEVLRRGAKVASVAVKRPRDPNQTIEPEEPAADAEPLEGRGLDQGGVARLVERLPSSAETPPEPEAAESAVVPFRSYVAVPIGKRGRRGPPSKRAAVPLVAAPPSPASPSVIYDETAVTIMWKAPSEAVLSYHVYEVAVAVLADSGVSPTETQLTQMPTAETTYTDPRVTWGMTRCYSVRAVEQVGDLAVESDEPAPTCVTPMDTFPPAAPKGLTAVASEGAISLIWEPNTEKDLDGYRVLRGAGEDRLMPVQPEIIHETTFRDVVPSGARYVYAIQAVDKSGNVSAPSNRVDETAR